MLCIFILLQIEFHLVDVEVEAKLEINVYRAGVGQLRTTAPSSVQNELTLLGSDRKALTFRRHCENQFPEPNVIIISPGV